ncbi:MAG: RIO1 family regulatory kinase/ATPase [Promethearchaeota archaeon]
MPHRFCAICGRNIKNDSPHFGMCLSCFLKEHPLFELPINFNFKVCLDCGSYSKKDNWISVDTDDIFFIIEQSIFRFLLKNYMKIEKIAFSINYEENSFIYSSKDVLTSLDVKIKGVLKEDKKICYEQKVRINISYDFCVNCLNLRGGKYYLSILQLRVINENYFDLIEQVLDSIQIYVEKLFERDKKQYISKIIDQKYGVDLLLSSNELLNHIISFLRPKYHFLLKRTKKLVGRDIQKGKNLYRLKALVKFLPFKKNDTIKIENDKFVVDNITKNKIVLRSEDNSKSVKNYSFFFNDKNFIKIIGGDYLSNDKDFDNNSLNDNFNSEIDELEKKSIDFKRIRKIDQTKKRATVDSVFDERTVFNLNNLLINGPLDKIEGIISAGKEANIYLAYDKDGREVAVKIYKIDSNTSKWMRNYIIGDPRFKKIPNNPSKIIFLWASKEFKNLKRAFKEGLSVPKPIHIKNNILIMEYIGFESIPAPKLKDIKRPKNPEGLLKQIFAFIKELYQKANLVHADLSEFNILYHNQKPVFIDISQAVDTQHPKAEIYLVRDIKNIAKYFEKLGVEVPNQETFYYGIIK